MVIDRLTLEIVRCANDPKYRDAKMAYYMQLRKKVKDSGVIKIINIILDKIYMLRLLEIKTQNQREV